MKNGFKRIETESTINKEIKFNGKALGLWIVSLVVSLVPFYISVFKYLSKYNTLDMNFWKTVFVKSDVLWVFSTVLLFALADSFLKKRHKNKVWLTVFRIIGFAVFLFSESTWILLNSLSIDASAYWPLNFSVFFIVLILILVTPLKVEFIKEG